MINRYEVEVTLTKKIRFTTGKNEKQLDNIFDEAEDYSDDFDRVIEILDNYNIKDIDIDEHSKCRIDDMELIEEFDNVWYKNYNTE